jgi:hypothetical protein
MATVATVWRIVSGDSLAIVPMICSHFSWLIAPKI